VGVATPMRLDLVGAAHLSEFDSDLTDWCVIAPTGGRLEAVFEARPLRPFAPEVVDFLSAVSEIILGDPGCRQFADVISFGFWIRRSGLAILEREVGLNLDNRLGRGVVFHVAPSNVPVNFAFSLVAGLLAGNANVVRVPSTEIPQVQAITAVFNAVLGRTEHQSLRKHVRLVRYDRSLTSLTERLSRECDVRIIWGGDATIAEIRRHSLGARAFDITFADRFSICVIGASAYLENENADDVARRFYNDTFLFDQNACTASHLVLWLGVPEEVDPARQRFWNALRSFAASRYELRPVSAVDKLTKTLLFAAAHPGTRVARGEDNLVTRIEVSGELPDLDRWRGDCGLFYERQIDDLAEIAPFINRRCQTLAYLGVDRSAISDVLIAEGAAGVDRVVPVGRTMEFGLSWDGHDLVRTLSRVIVVS
jgi:hypothetical protein